MAKLETVPANAQPKNGQWADLAQARPLGRLPADIRKRVADYLRPRPDWDVVVVLPGEVTHWVQTSAGEIVSFQSFLTGRLANALGADLQASLDAVQDSVAQPERLAANLRISELSGENGAVLGHLIGVELAAARGYWLGVDLVVLGEGALVEAYVAALKAQAAMISRG